MRKNEVMIASKIELLEVRKEGEASVGRDAAIKPTTTEIQANHMTISHVTPSHEQQSISSFQYIIFG